MLRLFAQRLGMADLKGEKGFTLVETLVGLALLVIIGVSLLASLTLSARVLAETDKHETARDLAVAEMEYVKNLAFAPSYAEDSSLIPTGSGFSVSIDTPEDIQGDGNLQLIRIIILRNSQEVTRLEDYKVKWQ